MGSKHIIIDARELRSSTGRYMERLLHHLQAIDHDNHYTVLLKPRDLAGWQPDSPNFTPLACPYAEFGFGEQLGFKRQLDGLKADLVHFGMTQQPVRYHGKAVTTIHDLTTLRFTNPDKNRLVFALKQQVYKHVVKRVAHKSAAIITPSQFVKDDLVKFAEVDPDKIMVTYEAAEAITDVPEAATGLEGHQFLVYVGRPTPHKNLDRLIEAFVALKATHPDLLLVLVGQKDANYERIETEVRQRTIKNVVFTGYVSEGRLRWLYENCAAYVFPSLSEGFGLPGLEAMVHGAPVVASNATCLPEIYGEAAHYFDPLNVTAMADAINEVLTDKALRQGLVEAGRRQAKKYSWKRMAEQTLEVYNLVT
jgi:glycosyltransferase involved in cell wall biosynthesis